MRMPICNHVVHVSCALNAAQYDVRCAICRTRDPNIESKYEREQRIFAQLQQYASLQEATNRRYNRRKSRVVRNSESLRKLKERLRTVQREFADIERKLDRSWTVATRSVWNTDAEINSIRNERRKYQRKLSNLSRQFDKKLQDRIGQAPPTIEHGNVLSLS